MQRELQTERILQRVKEELSSAELTEKALRADLGQKDQTLREREKRLTEAECRISNSTRQENLLSRKLGEAEGELGRLKGVLQGTQHNLKATESRLAEEEKRAVTAESEAQRLTQKVAALERAMKAADALRQHKAAWAKEGSPGLLAQYEAMRDIGATPSQAVTRLSTGQPKSVSPPRPASPAR
eukprot:Sspe_Gene.13151::Locus_4508_Transcript_1_1_Confidence_1.000_Length_2944::g.13151::m.13151